MSLLRSTSVVALMTFISRVLGFLRDMVIAILFGAGPAADAFFVAFRVPNFMRRLFAEGAFSQAFVPVLSYEKEQRSAADVRIFIAHMTGVLGLTLLCVVIFAMLIAPWLIMIFAPGFIHDSLRFDLATSMLRVTFPYLFFISMTACAAAILNTYGRFAAAALTPALLNIVMIVCAYVLYTVFAYPIYALAWGVCISGVVQFLFLLPFLKKAGLLVCPKPNLKDPGVRRVLTLMIPALFGVSVSQINTLVDMSFASFLKTGSVSWLYYSERLMEFPLGIFAVAVSTVVLPHLSKRKAQADELGFSKSLDWGIRLLLLIGLPCVVGLILLAAPLLASLFQYGHFDEYAVRMSSQSLISFALGLQFFMLIKVLASGFYARQDIKTPVKIGVAAMCLNIGLNFCFIVPLAHAGIALATSVSALLNAGLLFYFLVQKNYFKLQPGWGLFAARLLLANVVMGLFLYFSNPHLSAWFLAHGLWRAEHLLYLVVGAGIVYLLCLRLSGFKLLKVLRQT